MILTKGGGTAPPLIRCEFKHNKGFTMTTIADKIEIRQILVRMRDDAEYRIEELRDKLAQVDNEIFTLEEQAMMFITC